MFYFNHMRRVLLVGITLIVLTSASAAAQVQVGRDRAPVIGTQEQGGPILNCQDNRESYDRLSGLLQKVRNDETNQDAIKRTQALIRGSEADSLKADEKAQKLFSDAAMAEIKNLAKALPKVEDLVQKALKRDLYKNEKFLLESGETFKDIAENLEKLQKAAEAGAKFGTDIQNTNSDLYQNIAKVKKLLKESGILEKIPTVEEVLIDSGEKLAALLLGPVGGLALRASVFSIQYIAATEEGFISDRVRNQAVLNLERLHSSEENIKTHLVEINQVLADCDRADQRDQQREDQQANVEGGSSATVPIVIGTVAAVGAAGAYAASKLDFSGLGSSGSSSGSCGSSPAAEVNAACFPFSSACNAATAKMNTWCVCNGFSSFNVNTGGCQ